MTNREALTKIINGVADDEVIAWATEAIAKLDAKNDKRKNTKSKEQIANEGLMATIVDLINERGAMVASDIAKAMEISTQKASALCTLLVKDGTLAVGDKKVKGKGTVKEYSLAKGE